jgi:hypothetical protein
MCLIVTSSVFLGLTIYARYADCDPLLNHKITKNDELVSYYVMDIAGNILWNTALAGGRLDIFE